MLPDVGDYIPTLAIRPSEMNGLEYLPGISKDKIVPLILLAPWSSAQNLSKAMERVTRAYPHRHFFLDVDRDYMPTNLDNGAQEEWLELRDPADQFDCWKQFWLAYPPVMPCLQLEHQSEDDLVSQIEGIQEEEREYCLRLELNRLPGNLDLALSALNEIGTADYTVVVEGGWIRDPLSMYGQAQGLISGPLSELDGRVPIVVSCTSMPKGFQNIEGLEATPFSNHDLLDQLRRNTNRENLLYGDWASTRPREAPEFRSAPLPRIDYPTENEWHIARSREYNWGFQEAAIEVVNSAVWDGNLGIWGEEMIQGTADNPSFAIDTPQKNVAARVNIHLHRQANFGESISGMDLDEDWVD